MLDAMRSYYEPAVDEPDAHPSAELIMHCNVLGEWHRRTPDLLTTACGESFHSQFTPLRREVLTHPLCAECFTLFEIDLADARRAIERAATHPEETP